MTSQKRYILPSREEMAVRFATITRSEELVKALANHLGPIQGMSKDVRGIYAFVNAKISRLKWEYSLTGFIRLVESINVDAVVLALMGERSELPSLTDLSIENKQLLMDDIKRVTALYGQYSFLSEEAALPVPAGLQTQLLNRTTNGLFLRFKDGVPSSLLTPWGLWPMARSTPDRFDVEGMLSHLLTKTQAKERQVNHTVYGPTLSLFMVGESVLPLPSFNQDTQEQGDHGAVHAEWERLYRS